MIILFQTAQFFSTIMNKLDDMREQLMQNAERQHETEQKLNQFFMSHYGINFTALATVAVESSVIN